MMRWPMRGFHRQDDRLTDGGKQSVLQAAGTALGPHARLLDLELTRVDLGATQLMSRKIRDAGFSKPCPCLESVPV